MRKYGLILIAFTTIVFASCGSESTTTETKDSTVTKVDTTTSIKVDSTKVDTTKTVK
jgi:hypothetical protein